MDYSIEMLMIDDELNQVSIQLQKIKHVELSIIQIVVTLKYTDDDVHQITLK
jgi:hypothetical protein